MSSISDTLALISSLRLEKSGMHHRSKPRVLNAVRRMHGMPNANHDMMINHLRRAMDKPKESIIKPDPRDSDHTREGIFVYHNCSYCDSGKRPCRQGNPNRCEYPHARND